MPDSTRKILQWVVLFLAILITGQAVYYLIDGTEGAWPWISLILGPILAIAAGYNIWRFSKGETPGRS